jgi:hypothetical protein
MKSIKDIYYTPQLKHNLLSVGQLCEKNYKVVFENQSYIKKSGFESDLGTLNLGTS